YDPTVPIITNLAPVGQQTLPVFAATVDENTPTDRVVFNIDSKHLLTDYSAPFQVGINPSIAGLGPDDFYQVHEVAGHAYDLDGELDWKAAEADFSSIRDCVFTQPTLEFQFPIDGHKLYTLGDTAPAGAESIQVNSREFIGMVIPDSGGGFPSDPLPAEGYYVVIEPIEFTMDGDPLPVDDTPPDEESLLRYTFDPAGLSVGTHVLAAQAVSSRGCLVRDSVEIQVVRLPDLVLERTVTRHDTYFAVELAVTNVGIGPVDLSRVSDTVVGFQILPLVGAGVHYDPSLMQSRIDLLPAAHMAAGDTARFTYYAVPILSVRTCDRSIGGWSQLVYASTDRRVDDTLHRPSTWVEVPGSISPVSLATAVEDALSAADYLLITNPGDLFALYETSGVDGLLADMAHLARWRGGVLGYLSSDHTAAVPFDAGDPRSIDALINERGAWASQLAANWTEQGYLLLVGELEIIPSFSAGYYLAGNLELGDVDYTDAPYSNIRGHQADPELSIGRIVGDNAARLRRPIQASIAVASGAANFDSSAGYAVSGYPDAHDGTADWINFRNTRNQVADTLRDRGFAVEEAHIPPESTLFPTMRDKDVILLAGHGNWWVWDYVATGEVDASFNPGACRPLLVTESCLTGRYPAGYSLAEAFLAHGAAAYIGATEVTISPFSRRITTHFFYKWTRDNPTIGHALRDAKDDRFDDVVNAWDPNYLRFTNEAVQLYGDPKLEPDWLVGTGASRVSPASPPPDTHVFAGPLELLSVTVPDYVVTPISDTHRVEIPGGDVLLVPYQPEVPFYQVRVGYPAGTEIRDVARIDQGEAEWATGLNLDLAVPLEVGMQPAPAGATAATLEPWPDRAFSWSTTGGPGDTLTLTLNIYPFRYYVDTTNAAFTREWMFDIDSAVSPVEINHFWLARSAYEPGQLVEAEVYLQSTDEVQRDVIVDAHVRSEARPDIVSALPLRTLQGIQDLVSFSLAWPSDGFEAGAYTLDITIRDTQGVPLDHDSRSLDLGVVSAALTGLTVTPQRLEPGQQAAISFDIENLGTEVLSATATLRVVDDEGQLVMEHSRDVTALPPGGSVAIQDVWDPAGSPPGTFRIVATLVYDGRSAGPLMVEVQYGHKLYLPMLSKEGSD
ncbi:MAG TPA: C25 family cysteine peptidase, partial [Anaerolineae bacterium]|nr:C25 family cysteine peptidase [Anaerolineae bacterium]